MNYTDTQLKLALAKMLPTDTLFDERGFFHWPKIRPVLDTELLHLCWLVEETLTDNQADMYGLYINGIMLESETIKFHSVCDWHATWQQRTIALCKVKGIEIV